MEEDFYASIKLRTGEEIFAHVLPCPEKDNMNLILYSPITISSLNTRNNSGYRIEPWMKTTREDMFVIKMSDVITISETTDAEMIMLHQSYVKQTGNIKSNKSNISRKMGYISNVTEAKNILEKIYKNS
jgi:hypothetical protein